MSKLSGFQRLRHSLLCGLGLAAACGLTGCQSDYNGVTLPSGYYLQDDLFYAAPGPEMKVSREAAAMKEAAEEDVLQGQ